jgi:hypothetical protein
LRPIKRNWRPARLLASLVVSVCCAATALAGEQTLKRLDWPQPVEGLQKNAQVVLHVWNDRDEPLTVPILKLDSPPITAEQYALQGSIRYRNVNQDACVEMWSYFPDGSCYFSRTAGEVGPMQKITGMSDWRPVLLPFINNPGNAPPTKLVVNVVLPGKGEIDLTGMTLTQNATAPATAPTTSPAVGAAQASSGWWGPREGGWVGGLGGSAIGLLGGLVGLLVHLRAARQATFVVLYALIGFGAVALATGVFALARAQPYEVYYPLLLLGILGVIIPAASLPPIRRQYRDIELRRMQALDAA